MRKKLFITLFITTLSINSFGQIDKEYTIDKLFNKFGKEKNADKVKINGIAMSFAGFFSDTKGITGIEVCSFGNCDDATKQKFGDAIKNVKDNSYETMVSTNTGGNTTKIMIKINKDVINELVVLTGGEDPALIRIKGKIKKEDLNELVKENSKK